MNNKLPIIGLMGGIGSGKSTVASILNELGCVVADADANTNTILQEDDVVAQLVSWWGGRLLNEQGQVDHSALGAIVFSDSEKRGQLEALIHPRVRELQTAQFKNAPKDTAALGIDAPLLLEVWLDSICDVIIFIDTPLEIRQKRVFKTRGWDAEELDLREASQLPLDTKRKKADFVVTNGDELQAVKCQIENVLADIQSKQFNKN